MTIFITFALAGMATYALRSFIIVFGERLQSAKEAEIAIDLVVPALLAAIVASAIFLKAGELATPSLVTSVAISSAAFAVYRTGNIGMALLVGLPIFWIGSFLGLT